VNIRPIVSPQQWDAARKELFLHDEYGEAA
jgi:hypothetical protein